MRLLVVGGSEPPISGLPMPTTPQRRHRRIGRHRPPPVSSTVRSSPPSANVGSVSPASAAEPPPPSCGRSQDRGTRRLVRLGVGKVTIERPDGPVVQALLAAGLAFVVIPGRHVKALRGIYGTAGNKDDRFDACVLADTLRTDGYRLVPLVPDRPETTALRVVSPSLASVRVVPMCDRVREGIAPQLAGGTRPEDLVLPGPRGQQRHPTRRTGAAVNQQPAAGLQGRGRGGGDRPRPPGPARPPRPTTHLRHLAGRRRHPLTGDRRADGPLGQPSRPRRRRQPHKRGLGLLCRADQLEDASST